MKTIALKYLLMLTILLIFAFALIGCRGSEETKSEMPPPPPSATEIMQKEMTDCKTENESLKKQVSKLEQDARSAATRAGELEIKLNECKEKVAAMPPPPPPQPTITDALATYQEALNLFFSRNYQKAASLFQALLDDSVPNKLEDNCTYWLGECAYGEKKYSKAIEHFEKVFTFRISEKKDDSQIMIANSYRAMGKKEKAKEAYERLIKKFPASPFVKIAKPKLEKLNRELGVSE